MTPGSMKNEAGQGCKALMEPGPHLLNQGDLFLTSRFDPLVDR